MKKGKVKILIINNEETNENETVWADHIDGHKYELDSTPFYAYGLSWKDIIEAIPDKNGIPKFTKIITKSGHRTIRVISEKGEISDKFRSIIISTGCTIENLNKKFIAIDVPADKDFQAVVTLISESEYKWEYADPTYQEIHNIN